jgi:restriction system protein
MGVPDFQTLMLPILQLADDGLEHSLAEVEAKLGAHFSLTESDLNEMLPSGRQTKFYNRIGWAKTYLARTGLLQSTSRGHFCITQRGLSVLSNAPSRIDLRFLAQFEEFAQFRGEVRPADPVETVETRGQTPEELLDSSYQTLRRELSKELLDRVVHLL